jgi:outer membrane protein OmpA-like peptidoglycan-associated protein
VGFTDARLTPAYRIDLEQLAIGLDQLTSDPAGRSKLSASAKVDGYADLAVEGSLAPLDPSSYLDLVASLKRLEMSPLTPYAGRYVGHEIDAGRASLEVEVEVHDSVVRGDNQLVVENINFGKSVESDEATVLPVPTAAVLLADRHGDIHVDLPVKGNLNDPGFSYLGAMGRTLRTLIIRVVSTPLSVVGGMVSLGGKLIPVDELGDVPFQPGIDQLGPAERNRLEQMVDALEDPAEISVEVRGAAHAKLDADAGDLRVLARKRAERIREVLIDEGMDDENVGLGDSILAQDSEVEDGRVHSRIELK